MAYTPQIEYRRISACHQLIMFIYIHEGYTFQLNHEVGIHLELVSQYVLQCSKTLTYTIHRLLLDIHLNGVMAFLTSPTGCKFSSSSPLLNVESLGDLNLEIT